MWKSRSKHDLIIEVWEKLDCESVGRAEIEAIELVIEENYGRSPMDTPMKMARLLADEGAELRHAEILELDVERRTDSTVLPLLSNPLNISDPVSALDSIRELDRLRLRFEADNNLTGIRELRKKAISARDECRRISSNNIKPRRDRDTAAMVSEWLSIWIQSPDIYNTWIKAKYPDGIESAKKLK